MTIELTPEEIWSIYCMMRGYEDLRLRDGYDLDALDYELIERFERYERECQNTNS